jgi:ubiquitin carboxyl-terminal hydrolase 4/11/15
LEDILKVQREDEFLKKNNIEKNEKDSKNNKNKKLNLYELLNNFNQIEKLSKDNEWFCPKCKKLQLADKKMEIYSLSEIVIIHLKRFRNNRKIENLVEFPIEGLDLTKYLPKNNKEKYIYDLFAVANHVGGLHGGHYFAYCKNTKEGEWYEFNDTSVSKIEVKKVCSDNAYVLFYSRRRDEKIDEEELFKKPFVEIDISKYKSD